MDSRNTLNNNVKENIDEYHSKLFDDATQLAATVDAEPKMPRTCKRQTLKENHPADTALDYYRRTITSQFLEHMITQLDTRFQAPAVTAVINGFIVIPKMMVDHIKKHGKASWNDTFTTFAKDFDNDLPNLGTLKGRNGHLGKLLGSAMQENLPDRVSTTLSVVADMKMTFPIILSSLRLLGTISVTTCQCERSISSLRRLRTYTRSTMGQDRLNGLAALHVHLDIDLSVEAITDCFSRKHPRRLEMMNVLNTDQDDERCEK